MEILRKDVIPVLAGFLVFSAMTLRARNHPEPLESTGPEGWRSIALHQAVTIGGGYVAFLAIVLVFHVWIAGQCGAMVSAIAGGAFLAFAVAMPLFVAGSLIRARRNRLRQGGPSRGGR